MLPVRQLAFISINLSILLFSQYATFQSLTRLYFSYFSFTDLLSSFALLFQNVGRMNSNLKFHLIYCCFYCFCYFCYCSLNILTLVIDCMFEFLSMVHYFVGGWDKLFRVIVIAEFPFVIFYVALKAA